MAGIQSADVLIVGAGVMGWSAAYHLFRAGIPNILVIDRASRPGEGSTGRATGGFRGQFSTSINVQLSLLSREKLRTFQADTGIDPGYQPRGYLFLATSTSQMDQLRKANAIQKEAGLREAQIVQQQEASILNQMVEYPAVIGGAFCSTDGFIAPLKILEGYQTAAMRSGVRCLYDCRPLKFHKEADRITGVLTTQGEVSCGAVVNAAGAWANEVAKLAGLEIPVQPLKRQVAITEPTGVLPEDMPMTIFVGDGFHLRVRNGRVLFLWPDHHESLNEYDTDVSDEWIAQVSERAHARLPVLRSVAIDRANCWAGLYEMTPDKHALLGPALEFKNFYLINGSSGHGVMHSPALGQLLSEIVTEGKALTLDVSALRPTRFAEGHPNPVSDVL